MQTIHFEEMSDDRVLEGVEVLVGKSNAITAEVLAYLAEVDERKLHLAQACPSLFAFCVERLHMSEGAAGKRIWAARIARRFPLALEMIERGEIHLTALNLIAPHLTEENHADLLARAKHRSKRETQKLVAEIAPRPDVPSQLITVRRGAQPAPVPLAQTIRREPGPRSAKVAPLSPRRYELRVTIDEETHDKLRQLQDLLSHQIPGRDPAVIVGRAIDALLTKTLARKAGITKRPRASRPPAGRTRHIPASEKRKVWTRDAARCAFVDVRGQRCTATSFLQFHHVNNWARGAKHIADEIELRCRAHNLHQAEIDYGADFIAACRTGAPTRSSAPRQASAPRPASTPRPESASPRAREPSRVSEPRPVYRMRHALSGRCRGPALDGRHRVRGYDPLPCRCSAERAGDGGPEANRGRNILRRMSAEAEGVSRSSSRSS